MMIEPTIGDLLKVVSNKYVLVTLAAKRARELTEDATPLVEPHNDKPTTIALREIAAGKLKHQLAEEVGR